MANEHIGRLQSIGLGKESVSGTGVAATIWIPKTDGGFAPVFEKALDDSARGVIDEVADSQTIKNLTEVTLSAIAKDNSIGHFFVGALGTATQLVVGTITGQAGGTPARGDSVSSAAGSYTGTIKKIIAIGGTSFFFFEVLTGSFSDETDLTDGTWTGGTIDVSTYAAVKGHLFSRLNNNTHPSFTLYSSDPVSDDLATYCMVDTFDLEVAINDFAKFSVNFKGKKLASTGAQAPAFTSENPFLAKHASVKFAADEASLNAATASTVQRFKLSIAKNLTDIQAFGDTDISSFHNQQFNISGDLEATYNAITFRDYVINSTKKASRYAFVNSEVSAIQGAGATAIYPSIYIDMARLSFEEWSRSSDNNGLVNQTMGFSGEFKIADAMTIEILLINTNATGY